MGITPSRDFLDACRGGLYSKINQYIKDYPEVLSATDPETGWTGLHWAAYRDHSLAVSLLLKGGAKIDACDKQSNKTPLHWAIVNAKDRMVLLLLKEGANPNLTDVHGRNALHLAVDACTKDTVTEIANRIYDVHALDEKGKSALKIAEDYQRRDIIALLSKFPVQEKRISDMSLHSQTSVASSSQSEASSEDHDLMRTEEFNLTLRDEEKSKPAPRKPPWWKQLFSKDPGTHNKETPPTKMTKSRHSAPSDMTSFSSGRDPQSPEPWHDVTPEISNLTTGEEAPNLLLVGTSSEGIAPMMHRIIRTISSHPEMIDDISMRVGVDQRKLREYFSDPERICRSLSRGNCPVPETGTPTCSSSSVHGEFSGMVDSLIQNVLQALPEAALKEAVKKVIEQHYQMENKEGAAAPAPVKWSRHSLEVVCNPNNGHDPSLDVPVKVLEDPSSHPTKSTERKFYDLKKGKAVLININKVKDEPEEREGSRVDMQKMKHLLMQMSCDVECYLDVCADEIKKILKDLAADDDNCDQYDFLVLTIMSHGQHDAIFGFDGQPLRVADIVDEFSQGSCNWLNGKPKIFIFQCCRGVQTDRGHILQCDGPTKMKEKLPKRTDMCIFYATSDGYKAFRDSHRGSKFIQSLVNVMSEKACSLDFKSLATVITDDVASTEHRGLFFGESPKFQCPELTAYLRKDIYFPLVRDKLNCECLWRNLGEFPQS